MKSLTKRMGVLATVIAMVILMIVGSCMIVGNNALADTDTNNAYTYFYNQIEIDPIAQRFYKAFETLTESEEFKKGKIQYDLIANEVATKDEVRAYVSGADDNRLAKSFGIGRDAFYMDHPDLFYVDVFSTSIVAGMQGNDYVAYLDSSRVLSLYRGESMNSEALVNEAIQKYDSAIAQIVNGANAFSDVKEKIEYVNNYICENNTYGFGTVVEGDRNVDTPKADFIHTSYGALVNGESVCEGYAKSFKAVMDRLGIPCVCVSGYSSETGSEKLQPHMWNYVKVEGMWYGVDVTYNSASSNNPWMLVGANTMFDTHIEDGSVSSSGYELRYPAIKPYDYGVDNDENGMTVIGSYNDTEEQGKTLNVTVSYDDKGALRLQDEGKYLAYSFGIRDGAKEITWSSWINIVAINEALGYDLYPISDNETKMNGIGTSVEYIKFALIKRAPDSVGDYFTGDSIVSYNAENLKDEDFLCPPTTPYRNEGFGSYEPAPGATRVYPSNTGTLKVGNTYDVEIEYNTTLELDAGFTVNDLELDFYTSRGNDTVKDHAVIENFKWDGDKTITFTFTPSKMYIHNAARYYFTPVGLVGANSKKVPDPVIFTFAGKNVICSKIFNDGRLYMNVFGAPNLLDNSDVSITDFKDENGKYYAESQRSQLILVASKPDSAQEQIMDDVLKRDTGVKQDDIVASSSYEINLQICGVVSKVPNGAYMQVAFGFPEGYDPDDAGTTFKIYHYKHDNAGKIIGVEEIPVIVTEYGLIAKVTSFSPFTIVQIKNSSAAVQDSKTSNIYAYVSGEVGGTVTTAGKSGISQVSDKITYDITPDKGYTVACVRLNGKVIDAEYYKNGKLTLTKADIESDNMLEVTFMSQEFATSYAEKGVTLSFGESSDYVPQKSNVTGIVVGCVVAVVAIVAIAFAVWFIMNKNKKQKAVATVGVESNTATVAKSTTTKTTKSNSTAKKTSESTTKAKSIDEAKKSVTKSSAKQTTKSTADKNNAKKK